MQLEAILNNQNAPLVPVFFCLNNRVTLRCKVRLSTEMFWDAEFAGEKQKNIRSEHPITHFQTTVKLAREHIVRKDRNFIQTPPHPQPHPHPIPSFDRFTEAVHLFPRFIKKCSNTFYTEFIQEWQVGPQRIQACKQSHVSYKTSIYSTRTSSQQWYCPDKKKDARTPTYAFLFFLQTNTDFARTLNGSMHCTCLISSHFSTVLIWWMWVMTHMLKQLICQCAVHDLLTTTTTTKEKKKKSTWI